MLRDQEVIAASVLRVVTSIHGLLLQPLSYTGAQHITLLSCGSEGGASLLRFR